MDEALTLITKNMDLVQTADNKTFTTLKSGRDRTAILYKYDTPVHLPDVENKHLRKFPLFDMYMFSSLGIIFCYVFIMDFKLVKIYDKYFYLKRPSAQYLDKFTKVSLDYQSPYINIYSSPDGAVLISENNLSRVIIPSMVRKQKEKESED